MDNIFRGNNVNGTLNAHTLDCMPATVTQSIFGRRIVCGFNCSSSIIHTEYYLYEANKYILVTDTQKEHALTCYNCILQAEFVFVFLQSKQLYVHFRPAFV